MSKTVGRWLSTRSSYADGEAVRAQSQTDALTVEWPRTACIASAPWQIEGRVTLWEHASSLTCFLLTPPSRTVYSAVSERSQKGH